MNKVDIIAALDPDNDPATLFALADNIRREELGDGVHLRGLIEFSNHCRRRCYYCGIRAGNARVRRYRLTADQILGCARTAARLNYKTIVMQSGEDNHWGPRELADMVAKVKQETGLAITLSVGEHSKEDYKLLRAAGADRFLLRFETSDRRLFDGRRRGRLAGPEPAHGGAGPHSHPQYPYTSHHGDGQHRPAGPAEGAALRRQRADAQYQPDGAPRGLQPVPRQDLHQRGPRAMRRLRGRHAGRARPPPRARLRPHT
jgi:hypothetical protein